MPDCCAAALRCIPSASFDLSPCIGQIHKPVRIQAFVPESAVEALDMTVLHRLAGLNVDHRDAPLFAPLQKIRLVNSGPLSHRIARHATLFDHSLQHSRHLPAGNARYSLRSPGILLCSCRSASTPQRASGRQRIGDEIHRPFLVRSDQQGSPECPLQLRFRFSRRTISPSFRRDVDSLHIHLPALPLQCTHNRR